LVCCLYYIDGSEFSVKGSNCIYYIFRYFKNPSIVIQTVISPCNKNVCITHVCNTESGATFSLILKEYLGFVNYAEKNRF